MPPITTTLTREYSEQYARQLSAAVALRKSRCTQVEIAWLAGVTLSAVQRFERGKAENHYLLWAYNRLMG